MWLSVVFFFFQAEDGIRDLYVTGVQTCALPISILACGGRLGRFGDHLLGACEVSGRQEGRGEVEQRLCPFGLVPEQRHRPFEEADCGRHVAAGGGPSRGSGEQISSSRRE